MSRQKQVLVNPLPVPGFKFPANICLPDATVIFTDTSTISDGTQNAFTYSWNPPAGATGSSVSGLAQGIYNVVVKDSNNCPVSFSYTIANPPAIAIAQRFF